MSARIWCPLARAPFERFEARIKRVEVRSQRSPVAAQVRNAEAGAHVELALGQGGVRRLRGILGRVWEAPTAEHLPIVAIEGAALSGLMLSSYFAADEPVLAFEVLLPPIEPMPLLGVV